jgi:hypothetical protein
MLLQKVNKRHAIFNTFLISRDKGQLLSLKFDYPQHDNKWRIAGRNREFGRIGWALFWALGISILIITVLFILPRQV